jgi:hypothetical protein
MRQFLVIITLLLICPTTWAQPAGVTRVLRTFDFEERRLGNSEDLPMYWSKVQGEGLPHYVNGKLTTDTSHGGKYSFRFDLNGGGLIYRYDANQLPVQRGAHYRIEGFVKTTAFPHARARISAYFCDVDGEALPNTTTQSELYAAKKDDDPWEKLEIELSAADSKAAFLALELQLLQPAQYETSTLGDSALYSQDIHGTAWFDDITVSQVPRVTITSERPGNIYRLSDPLRLQVLLNDRFTDDLAAQLVIRDAEGREVYQHSAGLAMSSAEQISPGEKRMPLPLPDLAPGWYRVALEMSSQGQSLGKQSLDIVRLADDAPMTAPDNRFGIIATRLPFEGWDELPEILPFLGAGRVKLGVWTKAGDVQQTNSGSFDRLLERLQELRITPTACLVNLPPDVAKKVRGDSWAQLLKAKTEDWQPGLAYIVSRHANHLDRWQLGADDMATQFVDQKEMRAVYKKLYTEFAKLMQKPDLAMPWPAWYELDGELPATVALSVSPEVLPSQLPLYMQDLKGHEGHNLSLSLSLLDRESYGRETQIRDFAQRVVYALAADAQRIDLPLPFTVRRDGGTVVKQPQEMLMIARTLMTVFGGAQFKGKVPIAEGIEAFLFDRYGQGVLILWNRGSGGESRELAINLGQRPLRVDLWGNASPMYSQASERSVGTVHLQVGQLPVILLGVDGQLAQLRASIKFDNPLLESSFKPHTRRIQFTNPYHQAISGSVKLKAPSGWVLNPPTMTFTLNPGETFDREITIEFPYNSFAGPKTINADFAVQADTNSTFEVPITLKLGLSDVGLQTVALRDGNDVIVQQMITNYGEKPIDYTAFVTMPGQARQERLVTGLGAGRTTIKKYRFTNVKTAKSVRVRSGVKELYGTRVLNDEVEVQ